VIKAAKITYTAERKPIGQKANSWIILIEGIESSTRIWEHD